jgi:hypothetical protein
MFYTNSQKNHKMKKLFLIAALFIYSLAFCHDTTVVVNDEPIAVVDLSKDTTFYAMHPTFQEDSTILVNVTRGVLKVICQSVGSPIVKALLSDGAIGGYIVTLVAGFHRWIVVRRWKRQKRLTPKVKKVKQK